MSDQLDDAFYKALMGEDELGVVIRAHIHIEASLNEFINALIPIPAALPSLRYSQKVDLACALGLKGEHAPALKILGELRNAFAHRLSTRLDDAAVDRLYRALSPVGREAVLQGYSVTNSQIPGERPKDFSRLEPKDRFVLIAVSLWALLVAAMNVTRVSESKAGGGSVVGTE